MELHYTIANTLRLCLWCQSLWVCIFILLVWSKFLFLYQAAKGHVW